MNMGSFFGSVLDGVKLIFGYWRSIGVTVAGVSTSLLVLIVTVCLLDTLIPLLLDTRPPSEGDDD